MTGEMIVAVCLSGLMIVTGIFFIVFMKKEFAEKYTNCTTAGNSKPRKANSIGE